MIAKISRGNDAAGLLRYLYGPGRRDEHRDPHLVASWDGLPAGLEPEPRPGGRYRVGRLARLLTEPLALRDPPPGGPVWHCSLRAAPEDRELSDDEWAAAAAVVLDRVGISPRGDDRACRWVVVRHAPDHVHIAAVLARQDGQRVRLWQDHRRAREACRAIEDRFRLRATAPADRTATPSPDSIEHQTAVHTGREPTSAALRRVVRRAAATTGDVDGFTVALSAAGVQVRVRRGRGGELTGYAVAAAGDVDTTGQPVWHSGGRLAPDLSLPQLRTRWATLPPPVLVQPRQQPATTPAGAALAAAARAFGQATAPEVADAVHAVRTATAHVRASDVEAPGIVHAAGELLLAAAWVIEGDLGGPVSRAADRYDAAARAPHIPTPRTGPAGAALRAAARTLAALGPAAANPNDAAAVVGVLLGLVAAIAAWHFTHRRWAQLAAARDTQHHLHTTTTTRPRPRTAVATRTRQSNRQPQPRPGPRRT